MIANDVEAFNYKLAEDSGLFALQCPRCGCYPLRDARGYDSKIGCRRCGYHPDKVNKHPVLRYTPRVLTPGEAMEEARQVADDWAKANAKYNLPSNEYPKTIDGVKFYLPIEREIYDGSFAKKPNDVSTEDPDVYEAIWNSREYKRHNRPS